MDDIEYLFGDEGLLSKHIGGYRAREGQMELARAVLDCVEDGKHLLAEAPTGTGKSLATSLPGAVEMMAQGRTLVYVTANITLQEQLVNKDMPLVGRVLKDQVEKEEVPVEFKFALLKGLNNYLCKLNFEEVLKEHRKLPPWLREIRDWSFKTQTGDKSELELEYAQEYWNQVSTTPDECLKKECPHLSTCYAYKARDKVNDTHVVVTNYHMWFTDLLVREQTAGNFSLLPDHDLVIMDEAHEAAEIAMDFQGFQLSPWKIQWMVKGLSGRTERAQELVRRCNLAVEAFFKKLNTRGDGEGTEIIPEPLGDDGGLCEVLRAAGGIYDGLAKAMGTETQSALVIQAKTFAKSKACYLIADQVGEVSFGYLEDEEGVKRLGSIEETGKFRKGRVYYLERIYRDGSSWSELHCKVVNVRHFFRKHVFKRKTAIMTSATLSAAGSFGFILGQLGLMKDEFKTLEVPTPFDAGRVLCVIPKDFVDPGDKEAHATEIAKSTKKMMKTINAGMLVLFTSHMSLQHVAKLLRKWQIEEEVELFVQGEKPKSRIIAEFKQAHLDKKKALILGTSSFWQGVDIPGQALSIVAIDKIPFPRPDDPVLWYLEASGRNAFWEYSLPKAVITMKQGIGRLIRSEDDFGAVIVFDERINTKTYGGQFKSALPEGCFLSDDLDDVPAFLEQHAKRRKRLVG